MNTKLEALVDALSRQHFEAVSKRKISDLEWQGMQHLRDAFFSGFVACATAGPNENSIES